ncbi:hypothetical protein H5410_055282 [Solanum commersonii]|uniref:F-box domain-containing protein n=1 Tax=Solanum commersonii TaxID=4109 RepID=A0A9J5WIW0_SOLCO|nr:hypothetical protein H5410_055282 [Solanum commersonii]
MKEKARGSSLGKLGFHSSSSQELNKKVNRVTCIIKIAAEMDNEDRISYLPRDIIDRIFKLLSVEDAARTSILSTEWKYIWATVPNLVLDKLFCNKLALRSRYILKQTIDEILLQHIGNTLKFDLDISEVELSLCPNIDGWILYATKNSVKELKLTMPNDSTYKVPSYIFNCPTMTKLKLFNCVVKLPKSFLGFQKLTILFLENCNGTQYLNIISAGLELKIIQCLLKDLTLEKLLLSLTTLEILLLSSFELEVNNSSDIVEAVLKYIDTPTCSCVCVGK